MYISPQKRGAGRSAQAAEADAVRLPSVHATDEDSHIWWRWCKTRRQQCAFEIASIRSDRRDADLMWEILRVRHRLRSGLSA
jgi:hypothetical protein